MPPVTSYCKRFLHTHSKLVDFLSASLMIILCLVILLPKVHESFQKQPAPTTTDQTFNLPHGASLANQMINVNPLEPTDDNHNHNHGHHHHNHSLPIGEVLICAGFFVFYCIGLGLSKSNSTSMRENEPLLMTERKISTVCCSSIRCPTGQRNETLDSNTVASENNNNTSNGASLTVAKTHDVEGFGEGSGVFGNDQVEDECVFALNKHHNHHTHSRHHDHQPSQHSQQQQQHHKSQTPNAPSIIKKRDNYGTTSKDPASSINRVNLTENDNVYVEEIRIIRRPVDFDKSACLNWPTSIRYTLFGLLLSAALIIFDMNIHGLIETIKVFRATATGALLYIAFFIVLPRGSAGCNSCTKEEVAN